LRIAGGRSATMFLWIEAPSDDVAERLLEHGIIVSPGTFFGPAGDGYFRIALVPTEEECRRAATILERVL
jgi:aspartate/methionine/tyrosine aminotransferase